MIYNDDGQTTEPAYTISSPNEPKGSGELIKVWNLVLKTKDISIYTDQSVSVSLSNALISLLTLDRPQA